MGAPSFPNPMMDSFIDSPLKRNRHSPARTVCARRYRHTQSCLLVFEFGAPEHSENAANDVAVISTRQNRALGLTTLENFIQDLMRQKQIL